MPGGDLWRLFAATEQPQAPTVAAAVHGAMIGGIPLASCFRFRSGQWLDFPNPIDAASHLDDTCPCASHFPAVLRTSSHSFWRPGGHVDLEVVGFADGNRLPGRY